MLPKEERFFSSPIEKLIARKSAESKTRNERTPREKISSLYGSHEFQLSDLCRYFHVSYQSGQRAITATEEGRDIGREGRPGCLHLVDEICLYKELRQMVLNREPVTAHDIRAKVYFFN